MRPINNIVAGIWESAKLKTSIKLMLFSLLLGKKKRFNSNFNNVITKIICLLLQQGGKPLASFFSFHALAANSIFNKQLLQHLAMFDKIASFPGTNSRYYKYQNPKFFETYMLYFHRFVLIFTSQLL